MDDLAGELGMSKKTLYAHFTSKAELLEAVIQAKFEDVRSQLEEVGSTKWPDFPTALQKRLECLQRQLDEAQPPFLRDLRKEPETFRRIERFRHEQIQRHFGALLQQAQAAGVIRKDVTPALIVETLVAAVQGIMNPQKLEELGITLKGAFTGILKTVLEGVLTEGGRGGGKRDWEGA